MDKFTKVVLVVAALIPVSAASQVCIKRLDVPEYPPIAVAARWSGFAGLKIMIGQKGEVVSVNGHGSHPILVEIAKQNVKDWVFCVPQNKRNAQIQLRFNYLLEGSPVYPLPKAKVVIDLGAATVSITSPPMEPQP